MGGAILAILSAAAILGSACGSNDPGAYTHKVNLPPEETVSSSQRTYTFDEKKAWDHLVKQCDFGPRKPGTDSHKKCRDYIQDEMKKSCDNVRLQELTHKWSADGKTYTMWNILGDQNWKDAKTRVVLLAHWDTRPTADQEIDESKKKQPILGANDGASGVAVLLELMRAMKDKLPKDLGVLYVMTDGEDLGPALDEMFLGAAYFSKHLPDPKPNYGILLDMIGDKDLSIPVEPNSYYYAQDLCQRFYQLVRAQGFKDAFPSSYGPQIEDDHMCLNEAGLPTMDLIDFNYGPGHSWWHTLKDTPDKCSAASLGKVGKALETWLLQSPAYVFKKLG